MRRAGISVFLICVLFVTGWAPDAPGEEAASSGASAPAAPAKPPAPDRTTRGKAAGKAATPAANAAAKPANASPTASSSGQGAASSQGKEKAATNAPAALSPQPPAAPLAANQANAAPAQELPAVVVTATRLEQPLGEIGTTVTVVNDREIQAQKIQEVGEVLRQVPGVELTRSGSPGTITDALIRGASAAQTLVLIDGVEVNSSATGGFDLANLTTDNLDRIEVLRGAGGALYGSEAVGGVINLISKEGEGAPRFSLLSAGGNRATERQVLSFSGAEGELGYSGALSYFSTTGFRPINDSYDNLSGNIRLDYHLGDDTVLRGFARYIRSNTSLVNASNFVEPIDPDAHQRNEFMLFKGEVEHRFTDRLSGRWSGSFVRNDTRFFDFVDPGNPSADRFHAPDEIRATTLEAIYAWAPGFRSLAGFDFKDRWIRSGDNFVFPPFPPSITLFRAQRREYAGYVEQEGSLFNGRLLGTAGFRADGNSNFGQEVSPSYSVAIPIAKLATTLRGSYSEGFRAPSFNELFFPAFPGFPPFGNPNLKPEISSEYDGGFTKSFGELASFTATYFSRRVHSLIVAVPCGLGCVHAGNAGRVDTQGVELVPELRLADFKLGGNFTVIDQTHRSLSPAIRPLRVPKHSAAALAQYTHAGLLRPLDAVNLSLAYTYFGDRDDLDPTIFDPTHAIRNNVAYHRFDAVVSYRRGITRGRLRNEEIFTRVQNLFDRNYAEALRFKAPPINFVAGVKLDF